MAALAVDRRRSQDDEELFHLYGEVFGQALTESSRRRWEWQYGQNPVTAEDGPEIWVARDDGRILGQYASMPVRLWWGGGEVRASWGMDVFLRAEARGLGVGARLFTAWSDHVEVALGLGLTPSSYSLFQKLEYHDVGPVPFYRKVLDPQAVVRRRAPALAGVAAPLATAGLALFQREQPAVRSVIEVRTVRDVTEDYDALWERARGSYAMCVRRDRAYLDWKYLRCPHRRYDLREARREGALVGFAVSRHEDFRGLRLGWIIDLFSESQDEPVQDALLLDVLDSFREAGVARAQAFSLNAGLGRALRRRGFRPGRSPMQFCVRARVDSAGVFEDRDRWHVVFGDSDMDR